MHHSRESPASSTFQQIFSFLYCSSVHFNYFGSLYSSGGSYLTVGMTVVFITCLVAYLLLLFFWAEINHFCTYQICEPVTFKPKLSFSSLSPPSLLSFYRLCTKKNFQTYFYLVVFSPPCWQFVAKWSLSFGEVTWVTVQCEVPMFSSCLGLWALRCRFSLPRRQRTKRRAPRNHAISTTIAPGWDFLRWSWSVAY